MDSELSEEFEVITGMHQGSLLSPFVLAMVVDCGEFARELIELLCADYLGITRNKFLKWEIF